MRRCLFAVFALSVAALLLALPMANAAGFHARVEVVTFSENQALQAEVQRCMVRGLEQIDGVVTVSKESDFFITVVARTIPLKEGEIVVLAATSYGRVPQGSAEVFLKGEATREGIENTQKILSALVTIGLTDVAAGARDQSPFLHCYRDTDA